MVAQSASRMTTKRKPHEDVLQLQLGDGAEAGEVVVDEVSAGLTVQTLVDLFAHP
jgi:hypothetical protein